MSGQMLPSSVILRRYRQKAGGRNTPNNCCNIIIDLVNLLRKTDSYREQLDVSSTHILEYVSE